MIMHMNITNDWMPRLEKEFRKEYFTNLRNYLEREAREFVIYPDWAHLYSALNMTSFEHTKVVILGQDPYHGARQAHGLSFSVQPGIAVPPSLRNIFKELESDLKIPPPNHGCLSSWAKQGVLLLNTVLTVRQGQPNSHRKIGWEIFTDRIIALLNERKHPVIFILWGSQAQKKKDNINENRHYILTAPHPSPLSAYRGFFGSRPFSKVNVLLKRLKSDPIDWRLSDLT